MAIKSVAPGVSLVTGGFPMPTMNVYLLEDVGGGVTMFDAGVKSMVNQLRKACNAKGGLNRIVLGHGHPDHRGAAAGLGAPIFCHAHNVADAQGDGGRSYMDMGKLGLHGRAALPVLLRLWDGGPLVVEGTVAEGDEICGFNVIDIPGHAPGQICLFRPSDGVALTSDCFYTLDPQTGIKGRPRPPHPAFNLDEDEMRSSIAKVGNLNPSSAWPGHADPLTEDVRSTLKAVASSR